MKRPPPRLDPGDEGLTTEPDMEERYGARLVAAEPAGRPTTTWWPGRCCSTRSPPYG